MRTDLFRDFRPGTSFGLRSSVFGFASADSSGWFCCALPIAPDSSDYISFKTGPTGTYPHPSAAIRTENDFSDPLPLNLIPHSAFRIRLVLAFNRFESL